MVAWHGVGTRTNGRFPAVTHECAFSNFTNAHLRCERIPLRAVLERGYALSLYNVFNFVAFGGVSSPRPNTCTTGACATRPVAMAERVCIFSTFIFSLPLKEEQNKR